MKRLFYCIILIITSINISYSQLIISEYLEGSGSDRCIEIYNTTGSSINLSGYNIKIYANGSTSPSGGTIDLTGNSIPSCGTFVVCNSSASQAGSADLTTVTMGFTGDDAVGLYNGTTLLDLFGNIGHDPGSEWSELSPGTQDGGFVRNSSYCSGVTTDPGGTGFPTFNSSNWTSVGISGATLGSHTSSCGACGAPITNTITIDAVSSLSFGVDCTTGANGSVDITTTDPFTAGNTYTVQLSDASGSFASPTDIGSIASTNNSETISFTIPAGIPTGSGYRIRVVSSNPSVTSADNGSDITITNSGEPCASPSQCIKIMQFATDPEDGNNGTSANTGEFVQICNICDVPVDISCYSLCLTEDNSGSRRGECFRIPDNTTLAVGDCYLIGGNGTVSSGTPDWPSASLDLNWHTCGCVYDVDGTTVGQFVGVLSDGGEDITLFSETGAVADAITYESGGGAGYSETVNMPANGGCGTISFDIPPSSNHLDVGSTPSGTPDDEGWLFDCNTQTWGFANHNSSDGFQDLDPSMTYTCLPIPLPVEFTYFEGEKYTKYSNVLFWQTISEHNSSFFRIEKTNDFISWKTVGDRNAANESQEVINYQLIDDRIENIVNYYRLLQFDLDGKMTYYPKYVAIDNRLNSTDLSVEIFNLLGQKVDENYSGIQIHVYSDGTIKKVFK